MQVPSFFKKRSVIGQLLHARMYTYDGNVGDRSLGATTEILFSALHTRQQQQVMEGEWVSYAISIQNINGF